MSISHFKVGYNVHQIEDMPLTVTIRVLEWLQAEGTVVKGQAFEVNLVGVGLAVGPLPAEKVLHLLKY